MIFAPFRGDGCVSSQRGEAPQIKSPSGDAHLAARGVRLPKLNLLQEMPLKQIQIVPPLCEAERVPIAIGRG
jgi:hypothetical protein